MQATKTPLSLSRLSRRFLLAILSLLPLSSAALSHSFPQSLEQCQALNFDMNSELFSPEDCDEPTIICDAAPETISCDPLHESSCLIHLTLDLCLELGLENGGSYSLDELWQMAENYHPRSDWERTLSCVMRHELKHADDFVGDSGIRSCETEQNAFQEQQSCFEDHRRDCRFSFSCSSRNMKRERDFAHAAKDYNACICQEDPTSTDKCNECLMDCVFSGLTEVENCEYINLKYCAQEQNWPR
ncbi:MAG: hypothetical protein KDD64_16510 [Bdellovibrionales bacterium]|nr:hypothetical protein [Bdellovibrionales bacterium]